MLDTIDSSQSLLSQIQSISKKALLSHNSVELEPPSLPVSTRTRSKRQQVAALPTTTKDEEVPRNQKNKTETASKTTKNVKAKKNLTKAQDEESNQRQVNAESKKVKNKRKRRTLVRY